MKRSLMLTQTLLMLLLTGCLTINEKQAVPPPWTVEMAEASQNRIKPPIGEITPIYWTEEQPKIDGEFDEWTDLKGATTRIVVLGGVHDPDDAEATFKMKTDGTNLYVQVDVTDDVVNDNRLAGSMAWRGDSVEFFIGTDTSFHEEYRMGDNQVRIVPVTKTDSTVFEVAVNDVAKTKFCDVYINYTETGYSIEASIPLAIMMIEELKPGQKVKCEFQINDGDESERDRLVHWMSEQDNPWKNPSVWGKGEVTK